MASRRPKITLQSRRQGRKDWGTRNAYIDMNGAYQAGALSRAKFLEHIKKEIVLWQSSGVEVGTVFRICEVYPR